VLLSEAVETVLPIVDTSPLPFVGGVFAARSVPVVADPAHFMFGKINKFLMKAPSWSVVDIPRSLITNIIRGEPEHEGAYHKEVEWLVDYLIDCLRTTEDMNMFMTRNIFEKLLAFYASSSCAVSVKEKIVRLLFRVAAMGGSTTLITRCGVLSWVQMRLAVRDHRSRALRQLASRLYETSDKEKVNEWSCSKAKGFVAGVAVC
jgi:nucleolar pre-ribosomal-associated protein 1